MHVIGGQQLKWPPTEPIAVEEEEEKKTTPVEESKSEVQSQVSNLDPKEQLINYEMGFSLVIKAMIEAKKPLVGHNCMYDWLYLYNQFIDALPDTYEEFIAQWNKAFPRTFDTKVLAFNSKAFFKTGLGEVYNKCTTDEKFKSNLKFRFDSKNACTNYEGTELLSHYHEAAYDAHMTGVAFMHILKYKEMELVKNLANTKNRRGNKNGNQKEKGQGEKEETKEKVEQPKNLKNTPIELTSNFPRYWIN